MPTYHEIRDVVERALEQHGPNASALAGAIAELVRPEYRTVAYEDVCDKLRTAMWPPPRCACELRVLVWMAMPAEVR
jgi:hypothetical protein